MITWIITGITVVVSYLAFHDNALMEKLQFNAAKVIRRKQYYRLFSYAFVHVNWAHLGVNMLVLYFFGQNVEAYFKYMFGSYALFYYLLLYSGGILASNILSLIKHHKNYYYNSVGASGAVSAVLFTFIFLNPWEKLYLFAIIPIPGILFGISYLIYSYIMSRRDRGNIAHDAHFLGALFGFIFPLLLKPQLLIRFIDMLISF